MISSNREAGRRQHEKDFALTADIEGGGRGHDPRNVGSLEKPEKEREWSQLSQKEPRWHVDFSPGRLGENKCVLC